MAGLAVASAVLGVVLAVAAALDARSRRLGHRLRPAADVERDIGDSMWDARAAHDGGTTGTGDRSWMTFFDRRYRRAQRR